MRDSADLNASISKGCPCDQGLKIPFLVLFELPKRQFE